MKGIELDFEKIKQELERLVEEDLKDIWNQMPEAHRDLVKRAAKNYAVETAKIMSAKTVSGIDAEKAAGNLAHIKATLAGLGTTASSKAGDAIKVSAAKIIKMIIEQIIGNIDNII